MALKVPPGFNTLLPPESSIFEPPSNPLRVLLRYRSLLLFYVLLPLRYPLLSLLTHSLLYLTYLPS